MKFYKEQHKYYCGIDLHARKMLVSLWRGLVQSNYVL